MKSNQKCFLKLFPLLLFFPSTSEQVPWKYFSEQLPWKYWQVERNSRQWTKLKLLERGVKASPKAPLSLGWVGPGLQWWRRHSCLLPKPPQALTWKENFPHDWLFSNKRKTAKCSTPAYEEALTSVFTLITPSSVRVLVSITGNPSACKSINIFWEYKGKTRDMLFPSPHDQILLFLSWVL